MEDSEHTEICQNMQMSDVNYSCTDYFTVEGNTFIYAPHAKTKSTKSTYYQNIQFCIYFILLLLGVCSLFYVKGYHMEMVCQTSLGVLEVGSWAKKQRSSLSIHYVYFHRAPFPLIVTMISLKWKYLMDYHKRNKVVYSLPHDSFHIYFSCEYSRGSEL